MSTQYRLVQSGKTASGGCSAGPRFVRAVAPRIIIIIIIITTTKLWPTKQAFSQPIKIAYYIDITMQWQSSYTEFYTIITAKKAQKYPTA
jgi:hypothetical protein